MLALVIQAAVVNVVFILIGFQVVTFEPWTARTFMMAVFGEITVLILLVVKYLYTPTSDRILDFLDDPVKKTARQATKATRKQKRP